MQDAFRSKKATRALLSAAVGLAATAYWAIVAQRSAFFADDYVNFDIARKSRLTWSYLGQSVFGHFVPGVRLVDYVLSRSQPISHGLVATVEVALLAIFLYSFYRLIVLFGSMTYLSVFLFGIAASSAVLIPVVVWWSTSVQMVGGAAFGTLATYTNLQWSVNRKIHLLVISTIAYVCALAMNDGALIFVAFVALIDLVLATKPWNMRNALRALKRRGWAYGALIVPSIADLSWRIADSTALKSAPVASLTSTFHFTAIAFFEGLLPGFVGISYGSVGTPALRTAIIVVLVLVLVGIFGVAWWKDHTRWRAPVVALVPIILSDLVTGRARASVFGSDLGLDWRYQTANLVFLTVGIVLAFAPPQVDLFSLGPTDQVVEPTPRKTDAPRWQRPAVGIVCVALYLGHFYGTQHALEASLNYELTNTAKSYVSNFEGTWRAIDRQQPHHFVFDVEAAGLDLFPSLGPYTLLSNSLSLVVPDLVFDAYSNFGYVPEPSGKLVPGEYHAIVAARSPKPARTGIASCRKWKLQPSAWKIVARLGHTIPPGTWIVRIAYHAASPSAARVLGGGTVVFAPSQHQVFATVQTNRLGAVGLEMRSTPTACVGAINVGTIGPISP